MPLGKAKSGNIVAVMTAAPTLAAASVAIAPPGSSEPCNKIVVYGGAEQSNATANCSSYLVCTGSDSCKTVEPSDALFKSCGTPVRTSTICILYTGGMRPDPDGPCEGGAGGVPYLKFKNTLPNPVLCD